MTLTRLGAVFIAAAGLSASALGQGFVGLAGGQSRLDIDCAGAMNCDRKDTAGKIFGGYMFMPNLGVEVDYHTKGTASRTAVDPLLGAVTTEWKTRGFGLYGLAVAPFDRWSVFGKLGVVSTKVERSTFSLVGGSAGDSERKARFGWGVGAGYEFTRNIGARIEFERARVRLHGDSFDADMWTIGALYRF